MKKMILFDIDGTLLYTGGSGRIAFEKAFEELFGLKEVWQSLIPDGKTDPMIVEEIVQRVLQRDLLEEEYDQLVERYHEWFDREILNPPKFRILPGVPDLLSRLSHNKEWSLGVATGNYERAAWAKLKRGELHSFFQFGGFGSDGRDRVALTRKAWERGQERLGCKVAPEEVVLIGDTPHDVQAGKKLGFFTIAVATGRTSVREFKENVQPDGVLENLTDIPTFLSFLS